MQPDLRLFRPDAIVGLLAWLRLAAAATMAALLLMLGTHLALPGWLWLIPIGLAGFNGLLWLRGRRHDAGSNEIALHLLVDSLALWLLFWATGGATNPFVSLLLVPVALAGVSLGAMQAVGVSVVCVLGYTALLARYLFETAHPGHVVGFERHVIGMWLNFVLASGLLCGFLLSLAHLLRRREQELALERERLLRDDAIVSVATVAAGAAHAINTPLASISIAAESIAEDPALPDDLREDIETIRQQARLCGEQLRRLAAAQEPGEPSSLLLAEFASELIERWRVRRPAIDIHVEGVDTLAVVPVRRDAALDQALFNLLDNAADAAESAGTPSVGVMWQCAHDLPKASVDLVIEDPGHLDNPAVMQRELAASTKPNGLGLGLTLARASVTRLGGRLWLAPRHGGGTRTIV